MRHIKWIRAIGLALALLCISPAGADEKLKGIAARSVHLGYQAASSTAFYNEVTVDQSVPGSYFAVCAFNIGYFGIQELSNGKKLVIFSIWDGHSQDDRNAVPEDQRVKAIDPGEGVRLGRFGGEGSGGQSFFDYNWKIGQTYRFLVTAKPRGDRADYTAYFFVPETKQWKRLVTFTTIIKDKQLHGYYSFIEDFRRDKVSATQQRSARFGNGWIQGEDGKWSPLLEARFTADSNPVTNIDADLRDGSFFMATGGATQNSHAKLNEKLTRPSAAQPADLDDATKPNTVPPAK